MELPHLGEHCFESTCKRLDFLPMKCDACRNVFCKDHIHYRTHNCASSFQKDIQVPVCPLCNQPVPINRGELPDIKVGEHIDRDCQSDPAKQKRKLYTNKCSVKGCKQKELIQVNCDQCRKNYCLKHRHFRDHDCQGSISAPGTSRAGTAAMARVQVNRSTGVSTSVGGQRRDQQYSKATTNKVTPVAQVQSMDEDEAFAQAVQISLLDTGGSTTASVQPSIETEDMMLARAIAASEREYLQQQRQSQKKTSCTIA